MLPAYLQEASARYKLNKARQAAIKQSIKQHLYILNKQQHLVRYVPNRAQSHFLAHRTGRDLLLKARQLGFSTAIQADMFERAITETISGATLAHDDATTQKLRRMAARFYDSLPQHMQPRRGLDNATTTTYPETLSEIMIATAGNTSAGRGGTLNHLHGSEVAFWKNAAELLAGVMQAIPYGTGSIVLESTANGARGWFYEQVMAALRGESVWTLHFYPWWWDNGYSIPLDDGERLSFTDEEQMLIQKHGLSPAQIKWRRAKQFEFRLTPDLFYQEYPEDVQSCFLTGTASFFGDFRHALYTPQEIAPIEGCEYVAGVDWGQSQDSTVCSIFNRTTGAEVALGRWNRMLYRDMRAKIVAMCNHWHVSIVVPEANSASSNVEDLQRELAAAGVNASVRPEPMTNKFKSDLVNAFYEAIHTSGLKLLDDAVATHELRIFQSRQTTTGLYTYAAPEGEHDDTVMARLLAWHACLSPKLELPVFL